MALNKIQGEMLENNLLRNGQDLAVETDLLYISGTGRVGIKTASPRSEFDVNGVAWINNLKFSNDEIFLGTGSQLSFELGGKPANFTGSHIINVSDPLNLQDVVTLNYLDSRLSNFNQDRIVSGNSKLEILKFGGNTTLIYSPNAINKLQLTDTTASLSLDTAISGSLSVTNTTSLADIFISNSSITTTPGSGTSLQISSDNNLISVVGVMQVSSTTADKILFTGSTNSVSTSTNLTYNGSDLVLTGTALFDDIFIDGNSISTATGLDLTTTNLSLNGSSSIGLTTTGSNNITMSLDTGIVAINATSSLKIPVGTTLERPLTPSAGYMRFNTLLGRAEIHNGIEWSGFSADFAGITFQEITPDGISQIFVLNEASTSASIIVSINGIVQTPDDAYNVAGSNITFASAPLISDIIVIRFLSSLTTISAITDSAGDTKVETVNSEIHMDVNGSTVILIDNSAIAVDKAIRPLTNLSANLGTVSEAFGNLYVQNINGVPADIAENFTGDKIYEPGTVVVLRGEEEVQECQMRKDPSVAGVVSTDPAYLLNSQADVPNPIALCGRVPCKVVGPIEKGQLLQTSEVAGHAMAYQADDVYQPGVILGKAMENHGSGRGVILVLVTLI